MDVQNSTIYEGSFLSSKIPKLAFKLLLVVLLLGWSSQTVYAQCEDAHCLPDAAGNGPDASDAKLYCSNSASVLNGIINCTTAADTDGCGVDASVASGVDFNDLSLFQSENVPQQCYAPNGVPYNYIQWIRFATPEGINSVKLQGVGKMDAWAVFWAGSINTTGKTDGQITDEIRNFSTANLKYVEDACSAQNQYKTWINEDAVISNTDINVYFIALLYDVVSNGSINFKTKECEFIQTCQPEVVCPNEDITFCEGTGDLVDIQAWLDQFSNTDCGNQVTWVLTGEGLNQNFDGNAATIAALSPGTYTLTNSLVGTGLSCSSDIIVNAPPTAVASNSGPVCYDVTSITLDETGGDAVSWSWESDGGATITNTTDQSPTVTGFVDGEKFTVTITDGNGCTSTSETTVTVYEEPTAVASNSGPVCYDVTSITLDETGGDAVSWSWESDGGATITNTTDQSPTVTGFVDGEKFTVTITDGNGCTSTSETTVTVYEEPTAVASNSGPVCYDVTSITLDETGGDAVSWSWESDGGATITNTTDQSPTVTGFVDGEKFTVTITDGNGCTSTSETTVTVYEEPTAVASNSGPVCYDVTSITLDETGGDAVSWSWESDGGATITNTTDQSPTVTGFVDGEKFTVTITDGNGCTSTSETTVTVYEEPTAVASNSGPVCYDVTSITLDETGGDAVSWSWESDGGATITNTTDQSPTVTGFVDGEKFTVTITDGNGCTSTSETTVTVYEEPTAVASNSGPVCYDVTSITLDETGGDAVSWSWESDGGATITNTTDQSPTVTGFVDGEKFTVTITDGNGCTSTSETTVTVYEEPTAVASNSGPVCYDVTSITLDETGGDAVSWSWESDGGATITNTTDQSPTVTGFVDGEKFTVTITDGNGCTSTSETTVTVYEEPTAVASNSGPVCYDVTSITLDETGGDAVSWSWESDGGATITNTTDQSPTVTGFVDGEKFTVTITDGNGCTSTSETTVTVYEEPTAVASNSGPVCYDVTSITLDETGGDAVSWSWESDGGATITNTTDQSPTVTGFVDGEKFTVTITDGNGCTSTSETTVTVYEEPTAVASNSGPVCYDVTSITLDETGGDAVSWSWESDGGATITNTTDQSPTVTGFVDGEKFTVTITDGNGCTSTSETTVTVYEEPTAVASNSGPVCYDVTSITLDETGGDAVSWSWESDGGATITNTTDQSPTVTGFVDGEKFTVTITDGNGCTSTSETTVTVYPLPEVDVQIGDTTLCVVAGDVTTVTAAPLPPGSYDYVWTMPAGWLAPNPGNVSSFETGVIGTYSVTITNTDTGCTASGSGTINPVFEQVDPISFTSEYCASDAPATLFVEGPEGVDLVWYKLVGGEKILVPDDELGENGYPLAPTIPGDYVFIVEQAIGDCETSSDALSTITVNPNPDCSIMGETDVCEDILQTYTYNGADGDLSYEWGVSGDGAIDGGNTGSSVDIIPNGVGSYSVTLMVTDNETGCTSMCNYEVTTYDCCDSETAFGYDNGGNAGTSNICFLSDEAEDLGLNTNRWGWTIEGLDLETDISADEGNQYNSYTFELYAGNGNSCDPNEGPGTLVGDVTVTRVGDNLVATYDVSDAPDGFDYKLYTGHFNASCMPFPKKKKNRTNSGGPRYSNVIGFTVAPGQYTASGEGDGGDTVVIEIPVGDIGDCLDNFYVIAHAEVDVCTTEPFPNDAVRIAETIEEEPIDEVQLTGDFNMYPIPFKNEINVQYNFNYDTDVTITVYDIKGVVVYNKSFNEYTADTKGSAKIDMSRQSNQMFFVRVSTNRDVLTKTAISEGK